MTTSPEVDWYGSVLECSLVLLQSVCSHLTVLLLYFVYRVETV